MTHPDGRWISVVASGDASITPDLAVVSFAVTAHGKELETTRDSVNERSSSVLTMLRDLGVEEADLNAPDVAIHPEYDYRRGQRLIGYRIERQMSVRVRHLAGLSDLLDALPRSGANEVHGARMDASEPAAAEHEALRAAFVAARAKADVLAHAAGASLGAVARIEEEPDHAPPIPKMALMRAEAADASTEVVAGDLTITRRLRAWFTIE